MFNVIIDASDAKLHRALMMTSSVIDEIYITPDGSSQNLRIYKESEITNCRVHKVIEGRFCKKYQIVLQFYNDSWIIYECPFLSKREKKLIEKFAV